jgi:hypothetical protein
VPSPAALQFDRDPEALDSDLDMSTQWREHLEGHALGAEAILNADKGYTLVGEWRIDDIESLGFPSRHTPEGSMPIGCGHSSVYWPPASIPDGKDQPNKDLRNTLRSNLGDRMSWVHGEITISQPENNQ